jgi:DNA-binding XRE family transcriptional regulator
MFKPTITKEWLLATMELEGDGFANAGGIRSETLEGNEACHISNHHMQRKAFAKFVEFSRRKMKLTQMTLAEEIDADVAEIIEIEDGSAESVEPSTIYALAKIFDVPQQSLMALAGLTVLRDKKLDEGSIRFAACSSVSAPLLEGEEDALNAFVQTLSTLKLERM